MSWISKVFRAVTLLEEAADEALELADKVCERKDYTEYILNQLELEVPLAVKDGYELDKKACEALNAFAAEITYEIVKRIAELAARTLNALSKEVGA